MKWLKRLFCRHEWKLNRFQRLGTSGDYICTKCGKMHYGD